MRKFRLLVGGILAIGLIASFSIGYAYGIQYHEVNGIYHGCDEFSDYGCSGATNYAGDYDREANNHSALPMYGSWVSIDDYAGNQYSYDYEDGVYDVFTSYDTNPTYECKFSSLHGVESPVLNYHLHYTESALC
jgi:hypothetical protein